MADTRHGKELFKEADNTQEATALKFEVLKREDIELQSHIQVVATKMYKDEQRNPVPYSALDRRLGTSSKDHKCETCGKAVLECPGHWGYIQLQQPVFHWGYNSQVINILQSICKECSHVLLDMDKKHKYRNIMNSISSYIAKKKYRKEIQLIAKKKSSCPNCFAINGVVKKGPGLMKIVHDQYRNCSKKKKEEALRERIVEWTAILGNEDEAKRIASVMMSSMLNARDVYHLFKRIPEDDIPLLGMPNTQRPQDLILTAVPVPPIVIRPSVNSDFKSGTTEDDITMIINEIAFINDVMKKHEASNAKPNMIFEDWEYLQIKAALLINGQVRGIPIDKQPQKSKRGFIQRLKGKEGRFRGNLSGKRVDFSGRTVISPNPNLEIDEVGIPKHVAMTLTYPERVTPNNIDWLRNLVAAGSNRHPGANYWNRGTGPNTNRKDLKYGDLRSIAQKLKPGDVVERHLQDGDIVLFNRQPSLHKLSIMAHRVKVQNTRTFSFNECVCTPYNADFDGDEMNLHVPQTEEARAEALILMGNKSNLLTPRSGELMIGATQDFLTGAYLLTQKDNFLTKDEFCQLVNSFLAGKDETLHIDLPPPAIVKPRKMWSGKQVFSVLLRPNKKCPVKCNLRAKAKPYKGNKEELTYDDSYVVIRNSELLAGALDKSLLGSGGKSNVFYVLLRDWGEDAAIRAMARLSRLTSCFLMNRGFSIGIEDVMPDADLVATKQNLVQEKYTACDKLIQQHRDNTLVCMAGCTLDLTLEAKLLGELSSIREQAGNACLRALPRHNSPMIMANCGSKGSTINISQMISCVGQQAISGKRVPDGFENRALPHFPHYSKIPAAKGFVRNSFFSGLTPTEFFFHTMAGREGLVDTAVKTAETGYMQRRLMKGLEDLCVQYDNTVRNCNGTVVQFSFGEDGLDPTYMEGKDQPVEFERVLEHVKAKSPYRREEALDGEQITRFTQNTIAVDMKACGEEFKKRLKDFMYQVAARIDNLRKLQGAQQGRTLTPVELESERLTLSQLVEFVETCREKFLQSKIEPGTAVGALAAQSIGEPGTQMTLKTFHFAGVAAMNITLGVPRILEIMNASKAMSTPLIAAKLENDTNESFARLIKGRIEKTTLGEICNYIEEVIVEDEYFLLIRVDMKRIKLLKLEINSTIISYMIEESSKPKIKAKVERVSTGVIKVTPRSDDKRDPQEVLQELADILPKVVVSGIPSVNRAVITHNEKDNSKLELAIEGQGLRDVLATQGIDWRRTSSNNIMEVRNVLGIEAARATIIKEIRLTMQDYGITLDVRHLMLLADLMTSQGDIHGMTRFGLEKIKESVLMLASFEKTSDHLFDAAFYGQKDTLSGVSESIIMGNPMPMGTGLCTLLYKSSNPETPPERRPVLLDTILESVNSSEA